MTRLPAKTFATLAIAFSLLLAACGSDDSNALPEGTVTVPVSPSDDAEASTTTIAASSTTAAETSSTEAPATTEDTRTPDEVAADQLALMVAQVTGDLETVAEDSDCVIERLESEGVPFTGQGSPELAALVGCNPNAIERIVRLDPAVSSAETQTCLSAGIATWMGSINLLDAQAFFESPTPPDELITLLSSICDITEAEVLTALGQDLG